MHGLSMRDLVQDIIKNLPIHPEDEQTSIIESTAQQLYTIQEPELTPEDITKYSQELIEELFEEALLIKEGPNQMVARFLNKIVDQLPFDLLKKKSSIDIIIKKMLANKLNIQLERREVMNILNKIEAKNILDIIIEKVFDTGLDLIYYIND